MRRAERMLLGGALAALTLGAMAGSAHAGIWTAIPSGTSDTISAIEYQGEGRLWFATTNGKVAHREPDGSFAFGAGIPAGVVFNDLAFQPGSDVGLAVGDNDNVWRTIDAGDTWTEVALPATKNNDDCSGDPEPGSSTFDNAYGVAFMGPAGAYITGNRGNILRSNNSGLTWAEVNKKANDDDNGKACKVDATVITDVAFVTPTRGFFVSQYFGEVFETSTNLVGNTTERGSTVNNYDGLPRIVWDTNDPQRAWGTDRCLGCFSSTADGGAIFQRWGIGGPELAPEGAAEPEGLQGIAYAGGTVLTAGTSGQILSAADGRTFRHWPADGSDAGRDWKAVDLADAAHGAVGGANGALVLTTAANTVPAAPVQDPPAQQPPVTGRPGRAALPVSFSGPGSRLRAKVVGDRVRIRARGTLAIPAGTTLRAACRGGVTLTVKRKRTTLATKHVALQRRGGRCRFGKTISVQRSRVGRNTSRLRLKIAFKGNPALAAGQATKTLVVRR